ncbi:conserved hypothetical membrane protein [Mycobacterium ulcerans Agy99]|uniref:Conserved hypothetical membrane protein n=1 Tax=Mycobacterium ulcerans (strain Agy99) TaxID=362242 RepID=A0PQA5_MYCUA|nr:conserved hypothetical membrane protein [Mycobacterium ulcerans Agy99]
MPVLSYPAENAIPLTNLKGFFQPPTMLALYVCATVTFPCAASPRRWQRAVVVVVVAVGLFAAVIAGWALRSGLSAAALLQPAAWSQAIPDIGHLQLAHGPQPVNHSDQDAPPAHQKPFRNAWMTRDRPPSQAHLGPLSAWSPTSGLVTRGWQSQLIHVHPPGPPAATAADRDILTEFCVARR